MFEVGFVIRSDCDSTMVVFFSPRNREDAAAREVLNRILLCETLRLSDFAVERAIAAVSEIPHVTTKQTRSFSKQERRFLLL